MWRLNSPIHTGLMPPTLLLCGQLSFGLLSSPSSSSLLSNKTGITEIKKSFNKLAELGLHQSPLKPFYCPSEMWMKPSQNKTQWLTVRLSEELPSPCLPQLFYFDGFCLIFALYLWIFFSSEMPYCFLVLPDCVELPYLVICTPQRAQVHQ